MRQDMHSDEEIERRARSCTNLAAPCASPSIQRQRVHQEAPVQTHGMRIQRGRREGWQLCELVGDPRRLQHQRLCGQDEVPA